MDETGQAGDTGSANGGAGADARDRGPVNGWSVPDSLWSGAGAALDPSSEVPAWRRPSTEIRPFTRDPRALDRPYTNGHPVGDVGTFGRNGSSNGASASADTTQPAPPAEPASRWSDSRSRYADLLAHLSPSPHGVDSPDEVSRRDDPLGTDDAGRTTEELPSPVSAPRYPTSAPPYPYEGDLDDTGGRAAARPAFPAVRPSTPGGRPADRATAEPARHALAPPTPSGGLPEVGRSSPGPVSPGRVPGQPSPGQSSPGQSSPGQSPPGQPSPGQSPPGQSQPGQLSPGQTLPSGPGDEQRPAGPPRASYDPSSFPRRLPYEAPQPRSAGYDSADPSGYVPTTYATYPVRGGGDVTTGEVGRALPQRVPAEPDVPTVPEPPALESAAETPALARIATHLRRGDLLPSQERQEGFDVKAILAAVREVAGVRDASLRMTPAGANNLRLELSEGADAAEVSRRVARLLQDRMGLDAALTAPGGPFPAPPGGGAPPAGAAPTGTAFVPAQPVPAGRAPVSGGGAGGVYQGAAERVSSEVDAAGPRPLIPGDRPGPRVVIEHLRVNTSGVEATVEVRLTAGARTASGVVSGPAVDGYLLRLCAMATVGAVDELLAHSDHADGPARCFVEHAAAVPFGATEVAVVVLLLACGGWVEQLAGSALVSGDDRHAMVRATLDAVNRRLEALLS